MLEDDTGWLEEQLEELTLGKTYYTEEERAPDGCSLCAEGKRCLQLVEIYVDAAGEEQGKLVIHGQDIQ